jgi:hypothetical protein
VSRPLKAELEGGRSPSLRQHSSLEGESNGDEGISEQNWLNFNDQQDENLVKDGGVQRYEVGVRDGVVMEDPLADIGTQR